MKITRAAEQPSGTGPAEHFTGAVRQDNRHSPEDGTSAGAVIVTFEPGARTAWHTHPRGQLLIVTAGLGWVQREGGPKEEIAAGDKVWFAPGEKHWHGARDSHALTHVAVHEVVNGSNVDWMEHVSDADYLG
ncbi:cupin domain-containing protein [Oceanicola sp. 502str15]|uniref:(R)-mandelonitrile lyase n=1 Tax=Oceanicola sp. 502str15 TaxID=2696061 RepID=UPI0020963C08|nr:cupin domain-containing protein [Oceanicola sp. 502str15]MCO6382775.1 cupin domain-containing protein [Oceanicola sp. 502str15]